MTNQTTQPWGGSGGGKAWKTFTMVFAKSENICTRRPNIERRPKCLFFLPTAVLLDKISLCGQYSSVTFVRRKHHWTSREITAPGAPHFVHSIPGMYSHPPNDSSPPPQPQHRVAATVTPKVRTIPICPQRGRNPNPTP